MTKSEIEAKWPIAHIFDLLITFASVRPVQDDFIGTKQDILDFITAAKAHAMTFNTPRYDLFTFTSQEVKRKMVEGNFCQHVPNKELCGWGVKYARYIAPQYNFNGN